MRALLRRIGILHLGGESPSALEKCNRFPNHLHVRLPPVSINRHPRHWVRFPTLPSKQKGNISPPVSRRLSQSLPRSGPRWALEDHMFDGFHASVTITQRTLCLFYSCPVFIEMRVTRPSLCKDACILARQRSVQLQGMLPWQSTV